MSRSSGAVGLWTGHNHESSSTGRRFAPTALVILAAGVATAFLLNGVAVADESKLLAPDGAAEDEFGASVALFGGKALVGAPEHTHLGRPIDSGAAYLFDSATGDELFEFLAQGGRELDRNGFGWSVGLSDHYAVVGAPFEDIFSTGSVVGAVYFYNVQTGQQLRRVPGDFSLGWSVAIQGSTAAVGAPGSPGGPDSSVVLYDATNGAALRTLRPDDTSFTVSFGHSVDIGGGRVIVGDREAQDAGLDGGAAYVFDAQTGDQIAKLLSPFASRDLFFGESVAIDGGLALVGTDADDSASVYVFDATDGSFLHELVPEDDQTPSFGWDVELDNGYAYVSARTITTEGTKETVYVFDAVSGSQVRRIAASDGVVGDLFGDALAAEGGHLLAGARWRDDLGDRSGAAYFFDSVVPEPGALTISVLTLLLAHTIRFRRNLVP